MDLPYGGLCKFQPLNASVKYPGVDAAYPDLQQLLRSQAVLGLHETNFSDPDVVFWVNNHFLVKALPLTWTRLLGGDYAHGEGGEI